MTHEFKDIVQQARINQENGLKSVLATVVFLEGSSYRKPGVRMLISEDGKMTGAVSGGCVEKEVKRRAKPVFETNTTAVMMTYDGRYRLGCEGILYVLIEPFTVSDVFFNAFQDAINKRNAFTIESYYKKEEDTTGGFGSVIHFNNESSFTFSENFNYKNNADSEQFSQTLKPTLKLLIIGAEHDAVKLCTMASLLGWEVDVITSIKDPKLLSDFPGAKSVVAQTPEIMDISIDDETIIMLMTHNYAQDLKYLVKLVEVNPKYIGVLGSVKRREQLLNDLWEYQDNFSEAILSTIYSPAGLNIGAITSEEIAVSIISEILSIIRNKDARSLKHLTGKIHAK